MFISPVIEVDPGKAGTGKSEVIRHLIQYLASSGKSFAITISGQTLHSFSSISSNLDLKSNINSILSKRYRSKKYQEIQVLVIDEASMISPEFFDMLNKICQTIRKSKLPFGGIQIIISGDFHQLPPVSNIKIRRETACDRVSSSFLKVCHGHEFDSKHHRGYLSKVDAQTRYIFESHAWEQLQGRGMETVILGQVFRQNDVLFKALLDDLRQGVCSEKMWDFLDPLRNQHREWNDAVRPTILTAYRKIADEQNRLEINKLQTKLHSYQAIDTVRTPNASCWDQWRYDLPAINHEFDQFQAEQVLHLKVGAQVILIRNLSVKKKLVNGSRGVVIGFKEMMDPLLEREQQLPVVQFNDGQIYAVGYHSFNSFSGPQEGDEGIVLERLQLPLKLGWSLTIHKSQGMTLDKVVLDLGRAFAPGHGYVAMSRVKDPQYLSLQNFNQESVLVSIKVRKFYDGLY